MWNRIYIFVIFIVAACDSNKPTHESHDHRNIISRQAVSSWSTPETSPILKLIIIYSNGEFNVWESSDVGGVLDFNGNYKINDGYLILNDHNKNNPTMRYEIIITACGSAYLKSEINKKELLFPCDSVKSFDEWGGYIQSDPDFQKLVSRLNKTINPSNQ